MPLRDDWSAEFSNERFDGARFTCPHCGTAATFRAVAEYMFVQEGRRVYHLILQCDYARCRRYVYVYTTKINNGPLQSPMNDRLVMFPNRPVEAAHEGIPTAIVEDWIEAQKAFNEGAIKAAAVMCRRVLYGILLDKKCPEHPLHEGLKQLVSQARLPQVVEQWLTEIKEDGHDAAHPYRALNIPAENVAETMEYTKELLRFVYIEPFELQERLARKAARPVPDEPTSK